MTRFHGLAIAAALALGCVQQAQAAPVQFGANLGNFENPPTGSAGTGFANVIFDIVAHTMEVSANFIGLTGLTTAAHIHCCTNPPGNIGVATQTPTFIGFPSGVQSGTYLHTFDTTLSGSFNAAFITANGGTVAGAEAALFAGLSAGRAYFNIHTSLFPGGEIRGFLVEGLLAPVPEPATLALFGLGLAGLGIARRRRAA